MSTTVIEALYNARCNFETLGKGAGGIGALVYDIGMGQLNNAIEALENGKSPDDVLQEHIFGDVDTGAPKP